METENLAQKNKSNSSIDFNSFILKVLNHPFLHYNPYLLDEDIVIGDAERRALNFKEYPNTIIDYLDQCCCLCYIGKIRTEENPYTSNGEIVTYKTLPIRFSQNKKYLEIIVNKSDFNPRQYLTVCGSTVFTSNIFVKSNCDKYVSETEKYIKTCSTVNGIGEIEKYQNCCVLLAYSIPAMSGFGKLRMSHRLYSVENNKANVIREQILRTQQYILCSIINHPQLITADNLFNQEIFDEHLPEFKQMYNLLCVEIMNRGIEITIKERYLPTILQRIEGYFSLNCDDVGLSIMEYHETTDDYTITKYDGLFAIKKYSDCWEGENILDRDGNIFKPRLRNSIEFVESKYINIFYEQLEEEGLIVCYANDIYPGDYSEGYEEFDDEEDLLQNEYEHTFYFNNDIDIPKINNYYLGLINKYGQTIFELKSICSFRGNIQGKFGFKTYDNNYVIIYLSNSYSIDMRCYTKCGAINIRTGTLVIPLIFTEDEISRELSHCWMFEDKRYYKPGWIISHYFYGDDEYIFQGPVYKNETDILEQGKYAGHTIEDALHYFGNEILSELIFKDKIFIADTAFPKNIAHMSPIQRSIKLHQDKRLGFQPITKLDDTIFTHSGFGTHNELNFRSLYEGKTLQEIIEDENGMFYIRGLVKSGVLEISEDVIDDLMNEDSEMYMPLYNSYQSHKYDLEYMNRCRQE